MHSRQVMQHLFEQQQCTTPHILLSFHCNAKHAPTCVRRDCNVIAAQNKLYNLRWEGKIGAGDVVVMTDVLKLTECKTGLLQTGQEPLKCKCQNGHHVVHFHDKSLHSKLAQIKSKTLQNRILQALQNVITQAPDLRTDKTNCADNHTRDEFSHPPVTNIAANVTVR